MSSHVRNIKSYGILLERADPNTTGRNILTRKITLDLHPTRGRRINRVEVAFYERWSGDPGNLSFVSLPSRDFEDFYKILQTEDPLQINFTTTGRNSRNLRVVQLSTNKNDEPTGEGPKDRTGG